MASLQIESDLPKGWMPDGASVFIAAREDDDGVWESVAPEFSIVGRGESADDALVNAIELLDDYLLLCAREGKKFDDCYRSAPVRKTLVIAAELFAMAAGRKARRSSSRRREREYRIPLRLVGNS